VIALEVEVSEVAVSPEELSVELSEELSSDLAQDSIRPKANAKIVGKKRNFSFFIEPKYAMGK
jgi:hypothetical protein